jgi:hypothetical protein
MPTAGRRLLRRLKSAPQGAGAPGVGLRRRKTPSRSAQADHWPKASGGRIHSARMPTAGRRLLRRLKSAPQGAGAPGVGLRRRKTPSRSAQADHWPKASGGRIHSARMPTAGRRLLRRLKSAPQGAGAPGVGLRRRKTPSRSAQADHRPKAFAPIEIGPPRRCAPGVGLRRRKRNLPVGAGRPPAEGLWRPNSFGTYANHLPKAFAPIEIGPSRRCAPGVGLRRRKTPSRSAQADRRPKAPGGRIHSACRPTTGRRLLRRLKSALPGAARQASASADAKETSRSAQADHRPKASGGRIHSARMPTIGRRPRGRIRSTHSTPGAGLRRRFSASPVFARYEDPLRANSLEARRSPLPLRYNRWGLEPGVPAAGHFRGGWMGFHH